MSSPLASMTSPNIRLTSAHLLDGLDSPFNYTWAGVACLVVFVIYTSMRPKGLYVRVIFISFDKRSYCGSGCDSSNGQDWFLYILSRCHTVHNAWQRVHHGRVFQGE